MRHPDEGTIHGWLDGALPPDEAQRVEQHVAECPACAAAVAEARGLVAASSRILGALDNVPSGVVPERDVPHVRDVRSARRSWRSPALAAAAVLLLVVGVSTTLVQQRADVSVALEQGTASTRAAAAIDADVADVGAMPAPADAAAPTDADEKQGGGPSEFSATTAVTAGADRQVAAPAPPPAPVPAPAAPPAPQSAARTLQAPVLERMERTEPPRLPVTPDTVRRRIAGAAVVTQGIGQVHDSLGGRVVAANVERPRADQPGETDPLTRGALRPAERTRAVAPAERTAAAVEADASTRTAPAAPPSPVAMLSGAVAQDTGRVQLLVIGEVVDTTIIGVMRTITYELRPGIRVQHQVVERRFGAARGAREVRETDADTVASNEPQGERTLLRMDLGRVRALHWTDANGVHHSLSGPVEIEELERVRATLHAAQRRRQ